MTTVAAEPTIDNKPQESGETTAPPERAVSWPDRRHLWVLLAITVLGFVLRFSFPTRPPLWGDDAYTVYRTHADYQSMLDVLQHDGFTPLHYELYWLLGRITGTQESAITTDGKPIVHSTGLTPAAVRFLPALWGSLMPPVIYFLASQLLRRRIALAAALFAACSAYLLGYSRDGKMYMMLWMFSALSTACLLWWFRTGMRVAWLSWVAASLAMSSAHMPGVAMLPFQAIFFLTRSRVHWKEAIGFVIGLAIAAAGPAAYITQFNTWAQEQVEDFGFEVEGLGWVVEYNAGRDGPDLLRYATSAYLLSWEWPKPQAEARIQPWILTTLKAATWLLLFLAAIGTMPWSRRLRGIRENHSNDDPPQPWWRVLLWLGLWLVIPIYFMYCRSTTDMASPGDWWAELGRALGGRAWIGKDGTLSSAFWLMLAAAEIAVGVGVFVSRRIRLFLVWVVPTIVWGALLVALLRSGVPREPLKEQQWVQFVFRPLIYWADLLTEPFFLTGLAVILPGLILYYSAVSWPARAVRVVQFAAVAAALLLACHLTYKVTNAKLNKEIDQLIAKSSSYQNGTGQQRASMRQNAKEALQERNAPWQSIFMPRYVGFVWVPLCIGLCALYMRLPTRPLRIAAMSILIGVNLLQFRARLFAGTEPPLDRIARDIWQFDTTHHKGDLTGRTYVSDSPLASQSGHPGNGGLHNQQGKYYLGLARGYWFHPTEWKNIRSDQYFDIYPRGGRGALSPALVANDVRRDPSLRRVIVWETFPRPPAPEPSERNRFLDALGPGWRLVGHEDFPVRFHWNWTDLYTYRRSVYERAQ
jgi:4-amino-4-deoxy-L-arabinose transferase-like glycosyltransferase